MPCVSVNPPNPPPQSLRRDGFCEILFRSISGLWILNSTGALRHVRMPDGKPLVQGKEVTGFTNGEEEEVGLTKIVPFLVEDEMLRLGAIFSKEANWAPHVVSDGLLITGQNPHSSGPAAKTLLAALQQKVEPAAGALVL